MIDAMNETSLTKEVAKEAAKQAVELTKGHPLPLVGVGGVAFMGFTAEELTLVVKCFSILVSAMLIIYYSVSTWARIQEIIIKRKEFALSKKTKKEMCDKSDG